MTGVRSFEGDTFGGPFLVAENGFTEVSSFRWVTVASRDDGLDVATNAKVADDRHFPRIEKIHQIVEDSIRNIFVKNSLVAKLVQIKLEALQFHAPVFRNVFDLNGGKVREA